MEVRVFKELEDDLSESLGTSLPTDLTLTTTMADHPEDLEEEEDTDENQNKVRQPICTARSDILSLSLASSFAGLILPGA